MIYLYLFGTCFHFIYVFMIIGNIIKSFNRLLLYPFYFFFYVQLSISYEIFHSFSMYPQLSDRQKESD